MCTYPARGGVRESSSNFTKAGGGGLKKTGKGSGVDANLLNNLSSESESHTRKYIQRRQTQSQYLFI